MLRQQKGIRRTPFRVRSQDELVIFGREEGKRIELHGELEEDDVPKVLMKTVGFNRNTTFLECWATEAHLNRRATSSR